MRQGVRLKASAREQHAFLRWCKAKVSHSIPFSIVIDRVKWTPPRCDLAAGRKPFAVSCQG